MPLTAAMSQPENSTSRKIVAFPCRENSSSSPTVTNSLTESCKSLARFVLEALCLLLIISSVLGALLLIQRYLQRRSHVLPPVRYSSLRPTNVVWLRKESRDSSQLKDRQ